MTSYPTKIDGAFLLRPRVLGDARGFFLESWYTQTFIKLGIDPIISPEDADAASFADCEKYQ
jgi:dTDP-4-dehydrorhamnose 3,5-epimerase-like enzyme